MNLPNGKRSPVGGQQQNAGAVAFGGPQQAAPANFQVGAVGFGPSWDEEPGLRDMYDQACRTIVRMECEADELRAENAMLQEQARIITEERDEARRTIADMHAAAMGCIMPPRAGLVADMVVLREENKTNFCLMEDFRRETQQLREEIERIKRGECIECANYSEDVEQAKRERDEARMQYRTTELLGMALVKTIGQMKAERVDDRLKLADWRDCARRLEAAVEHYHPDLRDETEGGWSEERAAIALFDELERQHQVKRDEACRESCRDKAAADGGWGNI